MTTPATPRARKTTRHVSGRVTKDLSEPTAAPEYGKLIAGLRSYFLIARLPICLNCLPITINK